MQPLSQTYLRLDRILFLTEDRAALMHVPFTPTVLVQHDDSSPELVAAPPSPLPTTPITSLEQRVCLSPTSVA